MLRNDTHLVNRDAYQLISLLIEKKFDEVKQLVTQIEAQGIDYVWKVLTAPCHVLCADNIIARCINVYQFGLSAMYAKQENDYFDSIKSLMRVDFFDDAEKKPMISLIMQMLFIYKDAIVNNISNAIPLKLLPESLPQDLNVLESEASKIETAVKNYIAKVFPGGAVSRFVVDNYDCTDWHGIIHQHCPYPANLGAGIRIAISLPKGNDFHCRYAAKDCPSLDVFIQEFNTDMAAKLMFRMEETKELGITGLDFQTNTISFHCQPAKYSGHKTINRLSDCWNASTCEFNVDAYLKIRAEAAQDLNLTPRSSATLFNHAPAQGTVQFPSLAEFLTNTIKCEIK